MPSRANVSSRGYQQGEHLAHQHPSTPGFRRPILDSDRSSPLSHSLGGPSGQHSQEPEIEQQPLHVHHPYQHHSSTASYPSHPPHGYSNMPMYSGVPGGPSGPPTGTVPYHNHRHGGTSTQHGPPPPGGYVVHHHHSSPPPPPHLGYVVTSGPLSGGPPHPGYTMAYTTVPPPNYPPASSSGHPPERGTSSTGTSPPEPVRGSPHQPPYRQGGPHERSPSAGYPEHYRYTPSVAHNRPVQHSTSSTGGTGSPHPHYERVSPHGHGSHLPTYHHTQYPGPPPHMYPHPRQQHHPSEQSSSKLNRESASSSMATERDHLSTSHSAGFEMDERTPEEMQSDRDREAAEYELSLSRVKPTSTDFHWFTRGAMSRESAPPEIQNDAFLKNSFLNGRLKHAWESLEPEERMEYLKQEEADRRRFTEEEEVASRHCATLTARVPSSAPSSSTALLVKKDKRPAASQSNSNNIENNKTNMKSDDDDDDATDEELPPKRSKTGTSNGDVSGGRATASTAEEL